MNANRKAKAAGFLAAAVITMVTAGMLQPAMAQPVRAEESASEAAAADPTAGAPTGIQESEELTKMVNMLYRVFDQRVINADTVDMHADLASLTAEEKSTLLHFYQSRYGEADGRIQRDVNDLQNNVATKETLTAILTELFGSADEDTMNAAYTSYWMRGIDGDTCYMSAIGPGTMASNYIFSPYETAGYDEEGQIVLTGKVYDWSAPDFNTETQTNASPKGTYRIVLTPEGGPAVLGGCRFKEMTVAGA